VKRREKNVEVEGKCDDPEGRWNSLQKRGSARRLDVSSLLAKRGSIIEKERLKREHPAQLGVLLLTGVKRCRVQISINAIINLGY